MSPAGPVHVFSAACLARREANRRAIEAIVKGGRGWWGLHAVSLRDRNFS